MTPKTQTSQSQGPKLSTRLELLGEAIASCQRRLLEPIGGEDIEDAAGNVADQLAVIKAWVDDAAGEVCDRRHP